MLGHLFTGQDTSSRYVLNIISPTPESQKATQTHPSLEPLWWREAVYCLQNRYPVRTYHWLQPLNLQPTSEILETDAVHKEQHHRLQVQNEEHQISLSTQDRQWLSKHAECFDIAKITLPL